MKSTVIILMAPVFGTLVLGCSPSCPEGSDVPCCSVDTDCQDRDFCNGVEVCVGPSDAAAKHSARSLTIICCDTSWECRRGSFPCSDDEVCDERRDVCVATCETDDDCTNGERCVVCIVSVGQYTSETIVSRVCADTSDVIYCQDFFAPP